MKKPAYNIPSMRAVKRIEWNGYNVVSTFSGCGGSCLGYRMAGFRVLWASEFVKRAIEAYRANHSSYLDERDIREVTAADILKTVNMKKGQLDVLDGSPPCNSFSLSGRRAKNWGQVKDYCDTKQRADDLFEEYIRLLRGLMPRVFIAENVTGLIMGKARGRFKEYFRGMEQAGYRVKSFVLDARFLGVPQRRERVFFIGVRSDLKVDPVAPKPFKHQYAIKDVIALDDDSGPLLCEAYTREWHELGIGCKSLKYFNLSKADPNKPVPTILAATGGGASAAHPYFPRLFSMKDLARLASFPKDFIFPGSPKDGMERIGMSVPPLMMREVARIVKTEILDKITIN